MTVQSGSRCYTGHAKTGIERHTHTKEKEKDEKKDEKERKSEEGVSRASLPCIAFSKAATTVAAALTRLMHESSQRVYFCLDTLFPVPLSPFPAFPSDISSPSSLLVLRPPGCRLPSSVTPASARLCLACRLRHHQRPAITFLKR